MYEKWKVGGTGIPKIYSNLIRHTDNMAKKFLQLLHFLVFLFFGLRHYFIIPMGFTTSRLMLIYTTKHKEMSQSAQFAMTNNGVNVGHLTNEKQPQYFYINV